MVERLTLKEGDLVTIVGDYTNFTLGWQQALVHGKTYRVIGRSRIGNHPIIEGLVPIIFPNGRPEASVNESSLELI